MGVNVVDVFLKYWYQRPYDGHIQYADDTFGVSCETIAGAAIDRQWRIELDSPFPQPENVSFHLHIRTILARINHVSARNNLFSTAARLTNIVNQDNLHRVLFTCILASVEVWVDVTHNEAVGYAFARAISHEELPYDAGYGVPPDYQPLSTPAVILGYDLPDDLPERPAPPPNDDDESEDDELENDELENDELEDDELEDDELEHDEPEDAAFEVQEYPPGRMRWIWRRISGHSRSHLLDLLEDVPLEPCGPRIDPHVVSNRCVPPSSDTCVICFEVFAPLQAVQENTAYNIQVRNTHGYKKA
ncbi:hypothetical protein N0V90_004616 [Kalmusia sp. IMI 367209]|nr:hypothetical protein N0V90_004616 [Kalmusia sp. IMI 367209]